MKMTKGKTKRILLSLLLCGCFASTAYGAERIENTSGETITAPIEDTFTNLVSAGSGGAIENYGEINSITGSTFTGNESLGEGNLDGGGAVYNGAGGYIGVISGSNFSENKALWTGGAILNAGDIDFDDYTISSYATIGSIENCTFTENSLSDSYTIAGAIENLAGIIGTVDGDGNVTGGIINCTFTGNTADWSGAIDNFFGIIGTIEESTFTENEAGWGGAIFNESGSTIGSITGSKFEENKASEYGGAIANYGWEDSNGTYYAAIGSITDSTFTGNEAAWEGGAIWNEYYATIDEISDSTFTGNKSYNNSGGAIYNGWEASIGGISGSTFTENTSGDCGGAIYNGSYAAIGEMSGNAFTENKSGRCGGAIYNYGSIESITESTFTENSAASWSGGAIYNTAYGSGGGSIDQMSAASYATYIMDGYIGEISDSTFTGNTGYEDGGAIYNDGLILSIENNTFEKNAATIGSGGAIYNDGIIVDITDNTFTGNTAFESSGAIFNDGSIRSITGSTFTENTAVAYGGAIYNMYVPSASMSVGAGNVSAYASFGDSGYIGEISGSTFTGNSAYFYGGAICNAADIGEIKGNTFKENTVSWSGGALFNLGTIESIAENSFSGNTAGWSGGAIYNEGDIDYYDGYIYSYAIIGEITDSTFTGNSVERSDAGNALGGALYNGIAGIIGSMTGTAFTGNYVASEDGAAYGGAIYNAGIIGTIETGTLSGNYAEGYSDAKGGAIYDETSTSITIDGDASGNYVRVTGEGDVAGGVIYLEKSETEATSITVTGDVIGNHAETASGTAKGGAFYNNENGTLSISGDISGNYAVSEDGVAYGGAIYNEGTMNGGGELTVGNLTNNYAQGTTDAKGGAIYDTVSTGITIDGDASGNYVKVTEKGDVAGGVLYLEKAGEGETSVTVTGNVTGNHADTASGSATGGAFYNTANGTLNIGGDISGNYASSEDGVAWGGAVYNAGTLTIAEGAEISGNYAAGTTGAAGGAIYNDYTGETGDITADFSGNYVTAGTGSAKGGAVYNVGSIRAVSGAFSGNYAVSEESYAQGGAIYNSESGEITSITVAALAGNYAESGRSYAEGGAIYNENPDTVITVTGDIADNHVKASTNASGGAILSLGNVTVEGGAITGNYAEAASGFAYGGAILNSEGTLTIDAAEISGNYVKSEKGDAAGGAVYNEGTLIITAESLNGNYAESTDGMAQGGAIYTEEENGSISITGDVSGNHAASENGSAAGGAIYTENGSTITVTGDISENYAKGAEAATGGAIAAMDSSEITVTGDISSNYALSSDGDAAGGAISSAEGSKVTITGDVTGNYAEGSGSASGGAVFNMGDLTVTGSITDNYAKGEEALGGAIASMGILTVTGGDITGNHAEAAGDAQGGAIYNEGTLTVTADSLSGNYVNSTGGNAAGGAVYSDVDETTSITVTGAVSGNYATAAGGDAGGGAIYAESEGAVITITGDVTDNYATTTADGGSALGGAIYSQGTTTIEGAITGNYVEGSDDAGGGAIYNEGTLTVNATSVENNHAVSSAGAALAGAIYTDSEDSVINVTGNVTGNYVKAEAGEATGGAIHSLGTTTIEGDVTNNYAEGADAVGGAIYAGENSTVNLYGEITGNYAKGDTAKGGAIYNADGATVNIYVENKDSVISGNYVESGGEKEDNLLYGEAGSVTNFNLTDATLRVDDGITGDTGFEVNIKGNGTDATTFYMYNDIKDSNLSFAGTTLNTINNEVKTYSVNQFTVAGDFNMVADVDLAGESMDRFVTNGNSYGEAKGSLNVSGMNLISDTEKDRVGVYFAEPGLKENVTSSVGQLPGSEQQTAYTPLYKYNVSYDKNYDGSWGDDGGYFVFDKDGNNPAAMIPPVAQLGAFNAMGMIFEYCFEHSDYYMKLPSEVRLAIREKAKAAKAAKLAEENGTTVEEEVKGIEAARQAELEAREGIAFYDHDNVLPLYDQHELTRPGAWVKPFASMDTTPFKGHFTARDKYYGMLIGVDTDFREDRRGWASVFTGYAGYQGIHQSFSGGTINQDGGVVGVTETFYKKNFYTAWTAAVASTRAKGHTMYGYESSRLYTMGLASKSGWNLEYDGGKYIVLPTFMASYTNVNMRSYTNAAGLRMDAGNLRAVQLKPNVKWIRNYRNGWQPYLTAGEVWTVSQRGRVRADGNNLDQLCLHPYTEYGIGVQKRWANDYDGYAEFLGHAGGRRGALITLGFRWTFN